MEYIATMRIADGTALINSPETSALVDDAAIDPVVASKLEGHAVAIDTAKTAIAWKLVEIGKEPEAARELFGPRDAKFMEWAKNRCGICRSRVYEAIQVYEKFGQSTRMDSIQVSAIVMLSNDSVPDEVRAEALELAEAGVPITKKKARQLIADANIRIAPAPSDPAEVESDICHSSAACPNCGATEVDEDGDCASCFEPKVRRPLAAHRLQHTGAVQRHRAIADDAEQAEPSGVVDAVDAKIALNMMPPLLREIKKLIRTARDGVLKLQANELWKQESARRLSRASGMVNRVSKELKEELQ